MIKPTVGRNVYYRPSDEDLYHPENPMIAHSDQPLDAHIVHVWSDTCINLVIFDHDGFQHRRTSVPINVELQAGEAWLNGHAEWMPFQLGQAKPVSVFAPEVK